MRDALVFSQYVVENHPFINKVITGYWIFGVWNGRFPCDTWKSMLLAKNLEAHSCCLTGCGCARILIHHDTAVCRWAFYRNQWIASTAPRHPSDHGWQWLADSGTDAVGNRIRYAGRGGGRQSLGWLCPWDPKRSRSRNGSAQLGFDVVNRVKGHQSISIACRVEIMWNYDT